MSNYSCAVALVLLSIPAVLQAASWEATITVGGVDRRVYVPDTSRPVKAVLINNYQDPQGPDNGVLYVNADWRALGLKWNCMQMDWIGRKGNRAACQTEANALITTLQQVAATLGKPEIAHTGIFIQGLSGTASDAAWIASYYPGRVGGVIQHHYPDVAPSENVGVPCLYVVGGRDEFAGGFPSINLGGQRGVVTPRAAAGQPATLYLEAGQGHGSPASDQRFPCLWMDEILTLRFPATIPTAATISLPSWQNYHAWIGCFDAGRSTTPPWGVVGGEGDRAINNLIQAHPYAGGRPYVWLPSQRVADAWKVIMDTGLYPTAVTTVQLTAPTTGAIYNSGDSVTATATASATSGTVSEVRFYDNGTLVATDTTSASWSGNWTIGSTTVHQITAQALNSNGEFVSSSPVTVQVRRPADTPGATVPGLNYAYYEGAGITGLLPNFAALTPVRTGTTTTFDITAGGPRADNFAFRFTGYVSVTTAGSYTFTTNSDDGSKLYIGSDQVVDNDGPHGAQDRSGTVALSAGLHAITVAYAQGAGGKSLNVYWQGPGFAQQAIPGSALARVAGGGDSTPPSTPPAPTVTNGTTATPTLSGTTEAGATVRVYDGGVLIATTTANGSGAWSVTVPVLSAGSHTLTVTASDTSGNTSGVSPSVTVTVPGGADTTPPATPAAPTVTNGTTATPTLSGTTEAGATVRVYDGGVQITTATANGSGAWSVTLPTLSAGSHTLTIRAVDGSGNQSGLSPAVTVTVAGGGTPPASNSGDGGGSCGLGAVAAVLTLLLLSVGLRLRRD